MIKSGKIGVKEKNKEGLGPLLLAIDCEFSTNTLKNLIEAGCDINE